MVVVLVEGVRLAGELLLRTLPFIIFGVLLAELIMALRLTNKVSFLATPVTDFAHLCRECGASFIAAFVSPSAANAMLAEYFNRGIIQRRELFIASMVNTFPAILMHWRAMLPVLIPLLGLAGLIYFLLLILIGLIKTVLLMLVGRLFLPKRKGGALSLETGNRPPFKMAFLQSLIASRGTIKRIVLWTTPTMLISCIFIKAGVFDLLSLHLRGVASWFPIPPAGLGIIAAQFGNYIAGCTVAASLMSAGEITLKGVVLSLLVGDVLGTAIAIPRYLLPYYIGIFGPRIGAELMLISSAIRNGIAVVIIFALATMPGF